MDVDTGSPPTFAIILDNGREIILDPQAPYVSNDDFYPAPPTEPTIITIGDAPPRAAKPSGRGLGTGDEPPSKWRKLNDLAMANFDRWVPALFGKKAVKTGVKTSIKTGVKTSDGGFRVSSKSLGRDLQEDLSIHPDGIVDYGLADMGDEREGKRTPLDVIVEYGGLGLDLDGAFRWLSEKLGDKTDEPKAKASAPETQSGMAIVRVADVEGKKVDWLWPGRIALGKLTIFAGMPDVNKSTLTLNLASLVTTGGLLPASEGRVPLGSVIILTAEDDVADTVRPRLEVAGADLARVHVIVAIKAANGAGPRSFDLSQDIGRLEKAIGEIGDVLLVVIDPISAYMGKPGKLDSYRSTDVRATLAPLQETAARCGVAVIGIDHLNKSGGAQAMMRVLGSVAFVAAARAVYVIVRDEEDDARRLMLPAKNNLGKIRTGLAFSVVEKFASAPVFDAYPAIKWENEPVTMTADEALANKQDGRKSESAEAAKVLIAEMLAKEPMPQKEIKTRATAQGISPRSLTTAKKALGVKSEKIGAAWWWSLPPTAP
jgi:putative DNA primase/helicase